MKIPESATSPVQRHRAVIQGQLNRIAYLMQPFELLHKNIAACKRVALTNEGEGLTIWGDESLSVVEIHGWPGELTFLAAVWCVSAPTSSSGLRP